MSTAEILVAIITAAIGGGVVGQILRYLTDRRTGDQTADTESRKVSITEFETLHKRCLVEVARLSDQVHHLEAMVVALSTEVENLGGDPFAIRAALRRHHIPHTEGEQPHDPNPD